jgi:hypothetical protein
MHCKSLLILIVSVATVTLFASEGFSQCNRSNGPGNICANPFRANTGGTYLPSVEIAPNPTQPEFPNPVFVPSAVAESPFARRANETLGVLEPLLPSDERFTVAIEHPSGAADINVRTFSDRNDAEQLVQQLSQRFWVAYTDSANQRRYREASSSVDITRIANEIRATGDEFKGAIPVVARIVLPEDTSLEKLLGREPMVSPLPIAPDINQDLSLEKQTEEMAEESPLAAIEGIWTAVARSSNGELRTIELKLDSGGWARLTIPDALGQAKTIERRAVIEDGQLILQDGDQELLLGQIAQVKSNQFVVTRDNGQVTFLKQ